MITSQTNLRDKEHEESDVIEFLLWLKPLSVPVTLIVLVVLGLLWLRGSIRAAWPWIESILRILWLLVLLLLWILLLLVVSLTIPPVLCHRNELQAGKREAGRSGEVESS